MNENNKNNSVAVKNNYNSDAVSKQNNKDVIKDVKTSKNNTAADDIKLKYVIETVQNFEDFDLKENLLRGIFGHGFEKPSPVQSKGILPLLKGKDVLAQAQSGTGKTGCFLIGALELIDEKVSQPQVLVLAPTRELARQIHSVGKALGSYLKGFMSMEMVGGTRTSEDRNKLRQGPQLIIGTPGRTLANLDSRAFNSTRLKTLIIDEADEMLSRGFKDTLYDIFQYMPSDVQVGLFSATMKEDTVALTNSFLRDPVQILIKKEAVTLDGIAQFYVAVQQEGYKLETLIDLYECISIPQVIIFVNSRKTADQLSFEMNKRSFTLSVIHGQMSTDERRLTMREFRTGSSRVLITTDLLARGIDVQNVSLVINYDLPFDRENYIHRIGRSGRFGKKGVAINFVT